MWVQDGTGPDKAACLPLHPQITHSRSTSSGVATDGLHRPGFSVDRRGAAHEAYAPRSGCSLPVGKTAGALRLCIGVMHARRPPRGAAGGDQPNSAMSSSREKGTGLSPAAALAQPGEPIADGTQNVLRHLPCRPRSPTDCGGGRNRPPLAGPMPKSCAGRLPPPPFRPGTPP